MHGIVLGIALLLGTIIGIEPAQAETKTYKTRADDSRNQVKFVSEASVETVTGTTNRIHGSVDLDPENLRATQTAAFEVDLAAIKTGISLRDQHMRENHLETEEFPTAVFTLKRFVSADPPQLNPGGQVSVVAEGDLSLHGVTKTYQIPLTITRTSDAKGETLTVSGGWSVRLDDHDIPRPQFLFLRLAEEQKISVTVALTETKP